MEVTRDGLDWHPEDVEKFRDFLETQTGKRLIPKLAESAPRLLPGGQTNDIITRAGELLGFQAALQALLDLTVVPQAAPPQSQNAYPPLDDDTAWIGSGPETEKK